MTPRSPITTPAMRFIVAMWCGRKRRRKRFIKSVSKNHQMTAPAKKPAMIRRLDDIEAISREPSCEATPNIAKNASRYGTTVTKFAIVKPNIETKSRQVESVPARLRLI